MRLKSAALPGMVAVSGPRQRLFDLLGLVIVVVLAAGRRPGKGWSLVVQLLHPNPEDIGKL